jgi:hypothetical protein
LIGSYQIHLHVKRRHRDVCGICVSDVGVIGGRAVNNKIVPHRERPLRYQHHAGRRIEGNDDVGAAAAASHKLVLIHPVTSVCQRGGNLDGVVRAGQRVAPDQRAIRV